MKSSQRASEWPAAAQRNSWIYYRSVLNGERYTPSAVNNSAARPSWRSPINVETAVVRYGHAPYDEQNLLQVRRPRLGGSNERLDCDRSCRRHRCHVSDYLRQRGVLRPGQHTQLLQYPHDD